MKAVIAGAALLAAATAILVTARVDAAVITYSLDSEFSGGTAPAGPGPWITATFADGAAAGSVTLTVKANLAPGEFVGTLLLNLDPALDPSALIATAGPTTGTFAAPTVAFASDAFSAGGGSRFDIGIDFDNSPPANRFDGTDSVSYTLSGIPTLTARDFVFASAGGGISKLLVSAHVQGTGPAATDSGWVTSGPGSILVVPEPASGAFLALSASALLRRRRTR